MQAWTAAPVPPLETSAQPRVRVFDTATRALVPAGPAEGTATMYVCGITPYDATHLGHANTYLAFDLLHRIWLAGGLDVDYVQNVTDVDDPLLERAADTGVAWDRLAAEQIALFRDDMAALNVLPPTHLRGAVESIPVITELIAELQARSAVYALEDEEYPDLYYSVAADGAFGSVSGLTDAEARELFAERGGDPDRSGKKNPLDCLVWRLARPGEPSWPSPFGPGRPGWHVECTAIAEELLGSDFDVQGGGSDLIFPHHEMCASVGRVATGEPFAKTYVHAGMVGLHGEKMSKSRGNLVLVSRLCQRGVDPMAIRLALLSVHYRDDWYFTDNLLDRAADRLARWRAAVRAEVGLDPTETVTAIRTALATDLDAPTAVAAVDAWVLGSAEITDSAPVVETVTAAVRDPAAPAKIAAAVDALLGVRL